MKLDTGTITAEYGANWIGSYALLESLVTAGLGDTSAYARAMTLARNFILQFPMQTGYWTDGHSDNPVNSNTYKSNLSKSNAALYMFDHPEFDPDWQTHLPNSFSGPRTTSCTAPPAVSQPRPTGRPLWGSRTVSSTRWTTRRPATRPNAPGGTGLRGCGLSEKAYRSLNWVTYCSDAEGRATESPYSLGIATWWSDCYGEAPRMFYHAFAAMPEWAPPEEDHILYSRGVLTDVFYGNGEVRYVAKDATDTEYLRLSYLPTEITLDGSPLPRQDRPDRRWLDGPRPRGPRSCRGRPSHTRRPGAHYDRPGQPASDRQPYQPADGATFEAPALISLTADATGSASPSPPSSS